MRLFGSKVFEPDHEVGDRDFRSLLLAASNDALRKLQAGRAINFTGKAVTHKDGRPHIVLGRATPSSSDRGSVTFSIITDDAKIVFNTSYHFGI